MSLTVEVTSTPVLAQRRSERTSTDLESDTVVPDGSPAPEQNTVEITEERAVRCDANVSSSAAVSDDVLGMVSITRDMNCQSTSLLTEPRQLAADRDLSLFLDDVMGFGEDGPGGGADRGWVPTAGITTMDCLGGVALSDRPLLHFSGEASEDASSDIDVELRRIVASVAHNHNNDDVNSVTSDDCGTPDVTPLPAASLNPTQSAPPSAEPSLLAVSAVDDEILAALDSESATSTTNGPSLVNHCPTSVSVDCASHVTVSSCDGCPDNVMSSALNVVTSTTSGAQSNRTASNPLMVVSASCSETPTTSTTSSSLTTSAVVDESEQELTSRVEPCQQAGDVEGCDARRPLPCTVTENTAGTGCCQKLQPSIATTATSTDACCVKEMENLARSSSEVGQRDPVSDAELRSDAVSTVKLPGCPQTVHENNRGVAVTTASVTVNSSTDASNSTSLPTSSDSCTQQSVVHTSSYNGCSSQPNTARFSQYKNGSPGSMTSTTVSPRGRSSKSSELSSKKDDLTVNCIKTSLNSHATKAKPLTSDSTDVCASSERASVATQTNADLLRRYFHRRNKPVSWFLGGTKHSRSSGGCGAGLKERLSSRMSKSTVNCTSSSGSSAYHFGSTSSSAVPTTLPAVAGGTVLLNSGHQVAPLIMPAIGPLSGVNGKTTFLITVPANFTLPGSVGTVIGPTGSGGSVPVSIGLPKASVAAVSGSQLVARTAGSVSSASRLTATVSSTATALVLGQSALGTPLQLLVAAATALTTTSSTVGLSRASQPSLVRQQSAVVTVTCSSVFTSLSSAAQTSNSLGHDVMATSLASHGVSSLGRALISDHNGSSVRVGKSSTSCTVAPTGGALATSLQVAVRMSTNAPSTVVMLPRACSRSAGLLTVATSSSTVALSSSSSVITTVMTTTVPRCSPSSAASPTSSGARHATIASLPQVMMRRRSGTSDVVIQPASSSLSLGHPATVTLLNGLGHRHTPPTTVLAPSAVRLDGGGKSPVGGTTPTVVAKQPFHGDGAPTSIIRAILERNLSCPLTYNVDEALTGHHVAPPTPSPTDDHEILTVVDGYCVSALGSSSTSCTVNHTNEERRRLSVDSVLSRPASVCQMTSDSSVINDCAATRSERQNAVARKRIVPSAHHPTISSKYRRVTTDTCISAEQLSARSSNPEKTHTTPSSSAATESGSQSITVSTLDSSAVAAYGLSIVGSQQTGSSNSNGTLICEKRQRQQDDVSSTPSSTGRPSTVSEPVYVERTASTSSPLTRVALPKKVYAYLGSAGAARENAAAAAAASVTAVGDRPLQPNSTAGATVAVVHQNNTVAAGTATGRRGASDDGPISHLRLMCSGLAASAGGMEL